MVISRLRRLLLALARYPRRNAPPSYESENPWRMDYMRDLRLIELKYAWNCELCRVRLPVGAKAYWSPKTRGKVWCLACHKSNGA